MDARCSVQHAFSKPWLLCAGLLELQQRLQLRLLKPDWLKSWLVPALVLTRLHRFVSLCRQCLHVECGWCSACSAGRPQERSCAQEWCQLHFRHNLAHTSGSAGASMQAAHQAI